MVYDPTLTLVFSIFGACEEGKLYILRKIGIVIFKEIFLALFEIFEIIRIFEKRIFKRYR